MSFRAEVNHNLSIEGITYRFMEHPAAPGMPYGQTGRRATVYQVQADGTLHALKVFTPAFRSSRVAEGAVRLRPFAALPGLQVCARTVLTPRSHGALLSNQPDLAYAVLMPWIAGQTWQELLLGHQPFAPAQSLALAQALANILATMERRGLAHCDLSGPNLIIQSSTSTINLVDVEELYAPDLKRPERLPGGSAGYAHKTAPQGLWSAEADRFAGAVLLAEMLGWCDDNIRQIAYGEQYFDPGEVQQNTERYQRLFAVLRERWGSPLAEVFACAWHSNTLTECPTMATWAQCLSEPSEAGIESVTADVSSAPKSHSLSPKERLARSKVEAAEAWLELDDAEKALAELEEALSLAPEIAAPVYARAYLKRGTLREQAGDLTGALADYQTALSHAPTEGLQDELRAIIAEVEAKLAPPESSGQPETPRCPHCEHEMQTEWIRCPYCGGSLAREKKASQTSGNAKPSPLRSVPGWAWAVFGVLVLLIGFGLHELINGGKHSTSGTSAQVAVVLPTATVTPRPKTATPTLRPTATNTPKPTPTHTSTPTATYTPRPTPTRTPRPTATRTSRPTATLTPNATVTPKATSTSASETAATAVTSRPSSSSPLRVTWSRMGYEGRDDSSQWCEIQMTFQNNSEQTYNWPDYRPAFLIRNADGSTFAWYGGNYYHKSDGWPNGIEGDPPPIPPGSSASWTWYTSTSGAGQYCAQVEVSFLGWTYKAVYDSQGNLVSTSP